MTNEEIALHLQTQAATLGRIEAKVDKTNGRVTRLELWKAKMMGAWFVVSLAGPVIAGLIVAKVH